MKLKQLTFVLMLMCIVFSCVLNVKAQIPSSDDYTDEMLDWLSQHQEGHISDEYYTDWSRTDYANTKIAIKKAFNAWQARSDFETSDEYEARLRDSSISKFDELCIKYVKHTIRNRTWALDPVKYNIDKQVYAIDLYESYFEQIYPNSFKIRINVPMETDLAKRYRHLDGWEAYQVNTYYSLYFMINEKFVPCFFSCGYLFVDIANHSGAKEIVFTAVGCGISNKYLSGYTCHVCELWKNRTERVIAYLNAKKQREIDRKKQKRINDSLAIIEYKKQVEAQLNDYNQKLLENKHNIEKKQIDFGYHYGELTLNLLVPPQSYYEIYNVEDDPMPRIKNTYENVVNEITESYNSYNASIEHEYKVAKEKYCFLFKTEQEFEKYYCLGHNVFEKKVDDLQTVLYFDWAINDIAEWLQIANFQTTHVRIRQFSSRNIPLESCLREETVYPNKHTYDLVDFVNARKDKDYYSYMVSTIIDKNLLMSKEYVKVGFLFKTKMDFFDVYLSCEGYKSFIKVHKQEIKEHNKGKK